MRRPSLGVVTGIRPGGRRKCAFAPGLLMAAPAFRGWSGPAVFGSGFAPGLPMAAPTFRRSPKWAFRRCNYVAAHRNGEAEPRGISRAERSKNNYPGNPAGGAVRGRSRGGGTRFGPGDRRRCVRAGVANGSPNIPGVAEVCLRL